MNKYAVVLAAGKGTRMKSNLHKVLHQVLGKSMVDHAVTNLEKIGVDKIVTLNAYEADSVRAELKDRVEYAMQTEQLGTGHAVMMTKDLLEGLEGVTIVTYGDVPLLTEQTISNLFDYHQEQEAAITILTASTDNPTGYGRIIRDEAGNVLRIVEQKDANEQELLVKEINTGVCCYDNKVLFEALTKITNNNSQGEYYLTDLVGIIRDMGLKVVAYENEDFEETLDLVREVRYDSAFMFLYSNRKFTGADMMPNQIPDEVKHKRFNRLVETVNQICAEINKTYEGKIVKVLVEGNSKNDETKLSGRTDNGKLVNFIGDKNSIGKIVDVKITNPKSFSLEN